MPPRATGKKALIYGRVSFLATRTGQKRPSNETSVERQLKACEQYAAAQGWTVVDKAKDTVSGFKDVDRPGWAKVVKAVESEAVDVVLVHALDRAGRNTVKLLQFVETCQAHGVALVSVTQPIDTGSEYGGIIIAVLSAVAQMESQIKRHRALSKHLEDAEAGRYAGSYRLFGYTRDMVQVQAEVDAIRHGAEEYLNGTSLRSIAKEWNAQGLGTTPGNLWDTTGVRRLLENPILVGDRVHVGRDANGRKRERAEGTVYHGDWKPILTKSTQKKILARLAENEERQAARRSERYILTGLLRCTICENYLVGRPSGGVRRYVCIRSGRNHLGIAAEPVENYVGDMCTTMAVKRIVVRDPAELSAPLVAELDDLDEKLATWARNAAAAKLGPEEIMAGRAPLAAERNRIQAELDRLAEEPPEKPLVWKKDADQFTAEWAAMITARVDHVDVRPVGRGGNRTPVHERVEIHWRQGVEPVETGETPPGLTELQATYPADH